MDASEPITPHVRLRYGVRRGIGPEEADLRLQAVAQLLSMTAEDDEDDPAGRAHGQVDVLTGYTPADRVTVRRLAILLTRTLSKGAGNVRYTPAGWAQSPLGVLCGRVFAQER